MTLGHTQVDLCLRRRKTLNLGFFNTESLFRYSFLLWHLYLLDRHCLEALFKTKIHFHLRQKITQPISFNIYLRMCKKKLNNKKSTNTSTLTVCFIQVRQRKYADLHVSERDHTKTLLFPSIIMSIYATKTYAGKK